MENAQRIGFTARSKLNNIDRADKINFKIIEMFIFFVTLSSRQFDWYLAAGID